VTQQNLVSWLALVGVVVGVFTYASARRDASRRSATHIYVVVTSFHYGTNPDNENHHTRARVVNDSDTPIFDVSVSLWDWGKRRVGWRLRRHPAWMTSKRLVGRYYATLLPKTSTPEEGWPTVKVTSVMTQSVLPPFLLVFRDGNGRRWVRWPDGKLTRLAPSIRMIKD